MIPKDKQLHFAARFIITLVTFFLIFTTQAYAIDLSADDKQKHMLGSALIALPIGMVAIKHDGMTLKSGLIAFGVAMIPGLIKEGMDSQEDGNKWDNEDLLADSIGVAIGLICVKIGYNLYIQATKNSLSIGMVF